MSNTTSWRLTVKAVTLDHEVGQTFANVETKKDVFVRPVLPRVLANGDQATLTAFLHSYSARMQTVTVELSAPGLEIRSQKAQVVSLKPGEVLPVVGLTVPNLERETSEARLMLNRSMSGTLLNGLEYLTGYPYGCVEQTMSRALPNAVVARAAGTLGVAGPEMQARLDPLIEASIQRLYGLQHSDGGWGWWTDDVSDPYQTA